MSDAHSMGIWPRVQGADQTGNWHRKDDSMSFEELLASHRVSDGLVQRYLSLCERMRQIQVQLGQASDVSLQRDQDPDSICQQELSLTYR